MSRLAPLSVCVSSLHPWAKQTEGVQFTLSPDIARRPVGSLSGYQLTWYYYSYSHVYASILGLTQLGGGVLLLFRKTALLGAAVMTPVMANILMINLFFQIAFGAECMAAFIFASMVSLLWRDREAIVSLFWSHQAAEPANSRTFHRMIATLIVVLVIAQAGIFSALPGPPGAKISYRRCRHAVDNCSRQSIIKAGSAGWRSALP